MYFINDNNYFKKPRFLRRVKKMLKKDWELHHICLVVRDWNKTIEYYQNTRMGISVGPQVMGLDYRDGGPVDS